MKSTMFIPKKLKVGYQTRHDTFTGKLAYVIYYDEKGKLRKETSWENWRDKKIDPMEVDNVPTSGFVFNKGVTRFSDWGSGRSMIRIHDPRGFEFEITLDNLIGVLMYSDVSKRDIVEQCVFAWYGPELVLLPVNSTEYQESLAYTDKQDKKVSAKELVAGRQYQQKKHEGVLTYIGYHEWYEFSSTYDYDDARNNYYSYNRAYTHTNTQKLKGKKHVFWDGRSFVTPAPTTLSNAVSDDVVENYADLVDAFFKTTNSQLIVGVTINPIASSSLTIEYYGASNRICKFDNEDGSKFAMCKIPQDPFKQILNAQAAGTPLPTKEIEMDCNMYTVKPGDTEFVITNRSSGSQNVVLPFDINGNSPNMIGINNISHDPTSEGYYRKIIMDQHAVSVLNSMGYGVISYVLKNGNLAKYDN